MSLSRHTHTAAETSFSVKTEAFEGPLELLLELIEQRKFLINDISLAAVTDEYIGHVETIGAHPLKDTAQFVAVAATLLLIKSKSLLPVFELTVEEEHNIEELTDQLRVYQVYRHAARALKARFGTCRMRARRFVPQETVSYTPDPRITKEALHAAVRRVIQELPTTARAPVARVQSIVSLKATMEQLHRRIERQMIVVFSDFTGAHPERHTVVVGFLAVLEMVKSGAALAEQTARCAEIRIERNVQETPRYI